MGRICGQEGGFDQAVVSEKEGWQRESMDDDDFKSDSGMEMVKQLGPRLREHGPQLDEARMWYHATYD